MSSASKTFYFVLHLKFNMDHTFSSFLFGNVSDTVDAMEAKAMAFFNKTGLATNEKNLIILVRDLSESDLFGILKRNDPDSPSQIHDLVLAIEKTEGTTMDTIRSVLIEKGCPTNDFFVFENDLPCDFAKSHDKAVRTLAVMQYGHEKMDNTTELFRQFGRVTYPNSFC